ncbi:MAG: Hsp20/alpha crystallin family protein [Desulfohalobiaceae bacterium]
MVLDFNTLYGFPRNLERMFDELWNPLSISQRRFAYPPLNITQDENNIYVHAELPGVELEDVELTLSEGSLIIKGEKKAEEGRYFRQERPTGSFQRVVNLNVKVDRDQVNATMKDGLLQITLPKAEEMKPKQISIKTA